MGVFFTFLLNLFQKGGSDPRMVRAFFMRTWLSGCESANHHELDQRELHINRIFLNLAIIKLKLTQKLKIVDFIQLPYSEPNHVYKLLEKIEICFFFKKLHLNCSTLICFTLTCRVHPGLPSEERKWARICKRLRSPGIDSASLCNLASRYVKYRLFLQARQPENRLLGSLKGSQIRALNQN